MYRFFIIQLLHMHNLCYRLVTTLAIKAERVHPKHRLIKYKEWFLDNVQSDDIILDIGCNSGEMAALLSNKAAFVYGVEISQQLIDKARVHNSAHNIEYIQADATKFDYSSLRPISLVTLSNVLEHIDDRVDFLNKVVLHVNWLNNATQRFLIRVPMVDRDWITLYKKEMGVEWRLDPSHFTEYTLQQLRDELFAANLDIVNTEVRFGEIYVSCQVKSV